MAHPHLLEMVSTGMTTLVCPHNHAKFLVSRHIPSWTQSWVFFLHGIWDSALGVGPFLFWRVLEGEIHGIHNTSSMVLGSLKNLKNKENVLIHWARKNLFEIFKKIQFLKKFNKFYENISLWLQWFQSDQNFIKGIGMEAKKKKIICFLFVFQMSRHAFSKFAPKLPCPTLHKWCTIGRPEWPKSVD